MPRSAIRFLPTRAPRRLATWAAAAALLALPAYAGPPADSTWITVGALSIQPEVGPDEVLAYDAGRANTLLFGDGQTWIWDRIAWSRQQLGPSPSVRIAGMMAYLPSRDRLVMFGGYSATDGTFGAAGVYYDETWTWDGTSWQLDQPATRPPARAWGMMTYDSTRGVLVLFGGYSTATGLLGDTWTYDGVTWALRTPAVSPSPRAESGVAFDAARGVTVLYGGYAAGGDPVAGGQTWTWNGTTWAQRSPAASPGPLHSTSMAYDAVRAVTVLFGGSFTKYVDDTWLWDGTTWSVAYPVLRPAPRDDAATAYDPLTGTTLIYAGYTPMGDGTTVGAVSDSWIFTGASP